MWVWGTPRPPVLIGDVAAHCAQEKTTALVWAAYSGHNEVIEYLISRGADIERGNKVRWAGSVASTGHDALFGTQEGNTPLIGAGFTGKTDAIRILLDRGARIDNTNHVRNVLLNLCSFLGEFVSAWFHRRTVTRHSSARHSSDR